MPQPHRSLPGLSVASVCAALLAGVPAEAQPDKGFESDIAPFLNKHCIACHGPAGKGNAAVPYPDVSGRYAVYAAKQLRDYASGERKSGGPTRIMQDIASRLTEEEILAVSSYLQGLH